MALRLVFAAVGTLLAPAAALATAARGPATASHSTLQLSQARSDFAAASAGGAAVFGGGCSKGSSQGGKTGGGCNGVSAVIDIFRPSGSSAGAWEASAPAALSVARGWAAVCSFGPQSYTVAFLGGGGATEASFSTVLDLLSVRTGAVRSNHTALPAGRWGTACAASAARLTFAGGKKWSSTVPIMMRDEVYALDAGEAGTPPPATALTLVGRLSEPREDCGAVSYGATGSLFAGGWVSNTEPGNPSVVVDAFDTAAPGGAGTARSVWPRGLERPGPTQEWIGAVAYNDSLVYLADASTLYEVGSVDVFTGKAPPVTRPLPPELASAAGIPAARVQQNGVRIPGAVCFYASTPSSVLACFSPATASWQMLRCSATHLAGAMTAVDGTVLIGGGYDKHGKLTSVVDVFNFGAVGDGCDAHKDKAACNADAACIWCTSGAVPPACNSLADASRLPPSVFACNKTAL